MNMIVHCVGSPCNQPPNNPGLQSIANSPLAFCRNIRPQDPVALIYKIAKFACILQFRKILSGELSREWT